MPSTVSDKDVSTSLYIPVSTEKKSAGSQDGYQYFTILTSAGTNADAFMDRGGRFFNTRII